MGSFTNSITPEDFTRRFGIPAPPESGVDTEPQYTNAMSPEEFRKKYGHELANELWLKEHGPLERLAGRLPSGIAGVMTGLGSFGQAAGKVVGSELVTSIGAGLEDYWKRYKLPAMPVEELFRSDNRLGAGAEWLTGTIIEQVPNLALSTAAGVLTGGLGTAALGGSALARLASMGVGSFATSYALNAGEEYANLRDKGIDKPIAALAAGVPMGLLDAVEPMILGGKLLFAPAKLFATGARGLIKEGLKQGLIESSTEAAQEMIGAAVESGVGAELTQEEVVSRFLNAAAAGFVVGGAANVAVDAFTRRDRPRPALDAEAAIVTGQAPPAAPPEPLTPPEPPTPKLSPEQVIRGKLSDEQLGKFYTREAMTDLLGLGQDVALQPLVGSLLVQDADGNYGFSDTVKTALLPGQEPEEAWKKELGKDWSKPFPERDQWYLPTGLVAGNITKTPEGDFSVGLGGTFAPAFTLKGSTLKEAGAVAKEYATALAVLRGRDAKWGVGIPSVSGAMRWYYGFDPVEGTFDAAVEEKDVPTAIINKFSVPAVDGKRTFATLAEAATFAEEQAKAVTEPERVPLSERGARIVFFSSSKFLLTRYLRGKLGRDPTAIEIVDEDRYRMQTSAAVWEAEERAAPRFPGTDSPIRWERSVDKQLVPLITKDEHVRPLVEGLNAFVKEVSALLEQSPDWVPQNVREFGKATLGDVGVTVSHRSSGSLVFGQHMFIGADLSKSRIYMNPLAHAVWESTPQAAAQGLFSTMIHEILHSALVGHPKGSAPAPNFYRTLNAIVGHLMPAVGDRFIEHFTRLYGEQSGDTFVYRAGILHWRARLGSAESAANAAGAQTRSSGGRAAGADVQTGTGVGGTGGRTSVVREGQIFREEGTITRDAPEQTVRDDYRGDFPEPDAAYWEAINAERWAGEQFWRGNRSLTAPAHPEAVEIDKRLVELRQELGADVPEESVEAASADIGTSFRFLRGWETIIQMAKQMPQEIHLQRYVERVRAFWSTKTQVTSMADKILHRWGSKLDKGQQAKLAEMLYKAAERGSKHRLSPQEIIQLAASVGLDADATAVYQEVDQAFTNVLEKLRQSTNDEALRIYEQLAQPIIDQNNKEFDLMADMNYFPATRFGKFAVVAKADESMTLSGTNYRKGSVVWLSTTDLQADQNKEFAMVRAKFQGNPVTVRRQYLSDDARALMAFPPAMQKILAARLNLNYPQVKALEDIIYTLAPGHGFVKHMTRKSGTPGFSHDAMRVFADYMQHASNHIARLDHRMALEEALHAERRLAKQTDSTERGMLVDELSKHYADLMNPQTDFGALRGFMFTYTFGLVPKQILINTTQLPLFLFPYLANQHGGTPGVADAAATTAIISSIKDLGLQMRSPTNPKLTALEQKFLQRGTLDGFIDESFASEVAALGDFSLANRFLGTTKFDVIWRQVAAFSTSGFRVSEEWNRRVSFLAAMRMKLKQQPGISEEELYRFSREVVDTTMFEYAKWNRPRHFRGKKAAIMIFRLYLQHAAHFAFTGAGGVRFWLMMLLMGGLKGLPGLEDLKNLLEGSWDLIGRLLGTATPKADLEVAARQFFQDVHINPDMALNGLSRFSFGLTALSSMVGLPAPSLDFSGSIQLGKIIPGIQAVKEMMQGGKDADAIILRMIGDVVGIIGSQSINALRAASDSTMSEGSKLRILLPSAIRNWQRAGQAMVAEGYTNSRGQRIVPFNPNDPTQFAEWVASLVIGAQPTRVEQAREAHFAANEYRQYWMVKREVLLTSYAISIRDREATADHLKAIQYYNKNAPPAARISARQLRESINTRVKNEDFRSRGLPLSKRYLPLYQKYQSLYQTTQ